MIVVIFILQLITNTKSWIRLSDQAPDGNHFIKENNPTVICETQSVTLTKVEIKKELDALADKIEKTTDKITTFADTTTKTFTERKKFSTLGGIRLRIGTTTQGYKAAVLDCESDDSVLMKVTNENYKTVKTMITTLTPNNRNIWLPAKPYKIPIYEDNTKIPTEICNQPTTINFNNLNLESQCAYLNIDSLTFETDVCTAQKQYLCQSRLQPSDIAKIILQKENFLSLQFQYKYTSEKLLYTLKQLPSASEIPTTQRNFIKQENIEILEGFNSLKTATFKSAVDTLSEYIKNKINSITSYISFIESSEMNLIFATAPAPTTTTTTTTTTISTTDTLSSTTTSTTTTTTTTPITTTTLETTTTNLQKTNNLEKEPYSIIQSTTQHNDSTLVIKYRTLTKCSNHKTITLYPIYGTRNNLHKNVTFYQNLCYEVDKSCQNEPCHISQYSFNPCCSNIFNKTTHTCTPENIFPSFYSLNTTNVVFSGTKTWINDSCGTNTLTYMGHLDLTNNKCSINSDLPFLTYPITANFSKFQGVDPSEYNSTEFYSPSETLTIHKILPYASTLASVFSGLMLIISIIICCRRKNRTPQRYAIREPSQKENVTTNSWWCCCCNQDQSNQQPGIQRTEEIQLKPCLKKTKQMEEISYHSSSDSD